MTLIKGIVWGGTRTKNFEETVCFLRDVLGMNVAMVQEKNVVLEAANGDGFEVFPADEDDEHAFYTGPVVGFLVDDVAEARRQMEAKGAEFIGPIHHGTQGETWGSAWSQFRMPDGYAYVIASRPHAYPGGRQRHFRELRVVLAVDDLDAVKRFYGDGLGLAVVDAWEHPGGERGVLFAVCPAALEFLDHAQARFVDEHEVGREISGPVTLRIEVDGVEQTAELLAGYGAKRIADARITPWEQRCLRVETPEGNQLTLFELPEAEEAERARARALLPN